MNTPLKSAEHWEKLANDAESMATWEREHGIDLSAPGQSTGDHNARIYRKCAKSLRLEAETGTAHCMCHMRPITHCENAQGRNPILEGAKVERC